MGIRHPMDIILCTVLLCLMLTFCECSTTTWDVIMPGVVPTKDDNYMCTSYPVPQTSSYVVSFNPKARMNTAHHMIIFACKDIPVMNQNSWDCESTFTICKSGLHILYAWARNAPPRDMPKDVAFEVGSRVGINYLVLQVHYAHPLPAPDSSGFQLKVTTVRPKYKAGIYLLMGSGETNIPPHRKKVHIDVSCAMSTRSPIHVFAARTHAHTLGVVISGYMYDANLQDYVSVAKGNPQWPQAFYPLPNNDEVVVKNRDILLARCTYNSESRDKTTYIGPTGSDEMCNLYLMYYTEFDNQLGHEECGINQYPRLMKMLPKGNDTPLPPNPALEELLADHTHPETHHTVVARPGVPNHHLQEDPGWQTSVAVGDVGGVAVDKEGNVHVFHRVRRKWTEKSFDKSNVFQQQDLGPIVADTVLVFDGTTGKLLSTWGGGLFFLPHGIHIDADGNVWLTDVAMHQVFKFAPGGAKTPLLTMGKKFEPGDSLQHFCKPADVAVSLDGEVFIADGYCNSRILRYDAGGTLLGKWDITDGVGTSVTSHPFHIAHSVTLVERPGSRQQAVCAADRENGLIVCHSFTGEYLAAFQPQTVKVERLFAITAAPAGRVDSAVLYAVTGPSLYNSGAPVTGFTYNLSSVSVVDQWSPAASSEPFDNPHDVACSPLGDAVYVGEINTPRVRKFSYNPSLATLPASKAPPVTAPVAAPVSTAQAGVSLKAAGSEEADEGDMQSSMLILAVLAVPVVLIGVVVCIVRMKRRGRFQNLSLYRPPSGGDKFDIGGLLSSSRSRQGFERVTTEESDHDVDTASDDDVEEFSSIATRKA